MNKIKSNNKTNLHRAVSAAFAGMFAVTLLPVSAISTARADYVDKLGSESITVLNAKPEANKGSEYEIRAAYFGSDAKIPVDASNYTYTTALDSFYTETVSNITSSVTVTYKGSNEKVEVKKNESFWTESDMNWESAIYGTFTLDNAGEYIVTYNFSFDLGEEDNLKHKSFSTDYVVTSSVSSAYFEFEENDANVIPSVYDIKMQKGKLKNIDLPQPKVFDRNEKEIEGVKFYAATNDQISDDKYVTISVAGGSGKSVVVDQKDGKFYIDSKYFTPEASEFAGEGNYTIKYSFFDGGQFITSMTKSFTVNKEYYKDYKLEAQLESSLTSAITGVEVKLPKLKGRTSADTTPKNENLAVSYDVKAFRKVGDKYTETKDGAIKDGKFTPWADGYYKITYTATDFYGNKATKEVFIDGVKDTQKPVAKIYDGANAPTTDENGKVVYKDASSALKSKSVTGNIVIYAIGATDNVDKANVEGSKMKLTRTIKNSSKTIKIENKYNDKNLIFDYTNFSEFISANKYVENQYKGEKTEEAFKAWLIENNYAIVTNDKALDGKEGYAYLDITKSGGNSETGLFLTGSASGTTYNVVYYAKDAAGNESSELTYQMSITSNKDFKDVENPEITFPTNLKNSYRANSTIEFEKPSATDDVDTRMDITTSYYYQVGEHKYDAIIFEDDEYKIDLSEIKDSNKFDKGTPTSLVIQVKAYDDYGNEGNWNKEIKIADVSDENAPSILREVYGTKNDEVLEQNSQIVLPTITVKDDNVDYLNANVYVTCQTEKGKSVDIAVKGKTESKNSMGQFVLNAGKIIASYPGQYQVKVVITDAGNNQITTFYNYQVKGNVVIEDPVIVGLGSVLGDDGKGEVGKAINLGTPSIDYNLAEGYSIFGVTEDDSKAATDFHVEVVNDDAPSNYKFNENEENTFVAYDDGTYDLQYKVNIAIYNNKLFAQKDGMLYENKSDAPVYAVNEKEMLIQKEGVNRVAVKGDNDIKVFAIAETVAGYELVIEDGKIVLMSKNGSTKEFSLDYEGNLKFDNITKTLTEDTTYDLRDIKPMVLESDKYKVKIEDTTAPEMMVEYQYPTVLNVNDIIEIKKPQVREISAKGIDYAKSYVMLSYKGGATSYSTQYYLNKWNKTDTPDFNEKTGNIDYKVQNNGNYTISYHIYDYSGNCTDSQKYQYSIAVGDTVSPVIKIPKDFLEEKYELGTTLTIDFDRLEFSDNVTTDVNALKETVEIKLTDANGNKVENKANADENRYSFELKSAGVYKLEISVTDQAGWTKTETREFEVSTDAGKGADVYQVVGTVLIVVAALVLVGVIAYFVISKIKRDKKSKGKANSDKKKK